MEFELNERIHDNYRTIVMNLATEIAEILDEDLVDIDTLDDIKDMASVLMECVTTWNTLHHRAEHKKSLRDWSTLTMKTP